MLFSLRGLEDQVKNILETRNGNSNIESNCGETFNKTRKNNQTRKIYTKLQTLIKLTLQ